MNILFKFPTKSRPAKFFEVLSEYYESIEDLEHSQFLISLDADDPALPQYLKLLTSSSLKNLVYHIGTSLNKIDAINRDIELYHNWDIVVVIADDMHPQIKGFDNIIRSHMKKHYPDTDGVLFFNDGFTQLNTLPILGKKYYNRFGYVYCPEYLSVFADNEFSDVAKILGKQTYNEMVIIQHNHPRWTEEEMDELYAENESIEYYRIDQATYQKRMLENFQLDLAEAKGSGPTISICMIVRNEESNLIRSLPNLIKFADEIVIVDTGSEDNTVAVCKSHGIEPYFYKWHDDFASARNFSIEKATGEYIWWLDGDDELPFMSYSQAKHYLKKNPGQALIVNLVSINNQEQVYSGQLRVFPNKPELRFKNRIHEQIMWALQEHEVVVAHIDVPMFHLGYYNDEIIAGKLHRNINILEQQLADGEMDFNSYLALARSYSGVNRFSEALTIIDKGLNLWKEDPAKVSRDFLIMGIMVKASILDVLGHQDESIQTLLGIDKIYPKDKYIRLTLGESFFRQKDYKASYAFLVEVKDEKFPVGFFPVNIPALEKQERQILLVGALAIGDWDTVEFCMRHQLKDPDFVIRRPS